MTLVSYVITKHLSGLLFSIIWLKGNPGTKWRVDTCSLTEMKPTDMWGIFCLCDLGAISSKRALFDFSPLVGRWGEVEAGFVFSNSIVHQAVKEPELPVVCSNKPKLGLLVRHKGLQVVRRKKKQWCGLVIRLRLELHDPASPRESARKILCSSSLQGWVEKHLLSETVLQCLPDLLVSSKSEKLGSLVLVVYNKFSGRTPKSRSAWQRKTSSAITTRGLDYLYKIMNLFPYMPIISARRQFVNMESCFFPFTAVEACVEFMKMFEACGKLTPSLCWYRVISLL